MVQDMGTLGDPMRGPRDRRADPFNAGGPKITTRQRNHGAALGQVQARIRSEIDHYQQLSFTGRRCLPLGASASLGDWGIRPTGSIDVKGANGKLSALTVLRATGGSGGNLPLGQFGSAGAVGGLELTSGTGGSWHGSIPTWFVSRESKRSGGEQSQEPLQIALQDRLPNMPERARNAPNVPD
jgi:hypothetical protein